MKPGLSRSRMSKILRSSVGDLRVSQKGLIEFVNGIEDRLTNVLVRASKIATIVGEKKRRHARKLAKKKGVPFVAKKCRDIIGTEIIGRAIVEVGGKAFQDCLVVNGGPLPSLMTVAERNKIRRQAERDKYSDLKSV